jgi:hypothetical protein
MQTYGGVEVQHKLTAKEMEPVSLATRTKAVLRSETYNELSLKK